MRQEMPPIGCKCEWFDPSQGWTKVKIMYSSDWVVVLRGISEGMENGVDVSINLAMDKKPEFREVFCE